MLLNTAKASPTALINASRIFITKGQHHDAIKYLEEVLRRDAKNDEAMFLLAKTYALLRLQDPAAYYYISAMRTNPSNLSYKQGFIKLMSLIHMQTYNKEVDNAVIECMNSAEAGQTDFLPLDTFWFEHLLCNPAFHTAFALKERKPFDPLNKEFFAKISNYKPIFTSAFLLGIKNLVVHNPLFEEFITHIRKQLLENKFTPEESMALAPALSHYSFNTNFILDCTEEEQKTIDALRLKVGTGQGDALSICLLACYIPLYTLKNANDILHSFSASAVLADILKIQVADYNALQEAASEITAITPIDNSTSKKVREQYEEFPYPRWISLPASESSSSALNNLRGKKAKVLCAGCGTGQEPITLAQALPNAEILAIDLSRASLAYAMNKAKEYGIKNITFRQADILQLGTLDQQFDCITSCGVLHHLQDPVSGWKILCSLLKTGGLMCVALYSKIARRDVIAVQNIAQKAGYGRDAEGIKSFRKKAPQLLDAAVLKNISSYSDYYFLNMYRDLLFHVQEENYDLLEIDKILKQLNLEFVCFRHESPQALMEKYDRQFPGDSSRTSLESWHLAELENPDMFRGMYLFYCRKRK